MSDNYGLFFPSHSMVCYHEPRIHDHELYFQLRNLNLLLLLPIALIGIFCNACAMVSLYRPPKITSGVFVYLKALLLLDHVMLTTTLAAEFFPQICDQHHMKNHTFYSACMLERRFLKYTMPRVEITIHTLHVWTIATLSAHRYWKISRPMIARLQDTVSRARTMLIVMFCMVVIFRLPIFLLELEVRSYPQLRINKRIATTEILSTYRFVYHSILDPLFFNIVPFLWMCIFSLLTLYEIYKSRHNTYQHLAFDHPKQTNVTHPLAGCFPKKAELIRQKQELRATFLIVAIILLYLCFHSLKLFAVGRKWQLLVRRECPTRKDYYHSHLSDVLSMISASVNAFVFIAFTNRLKKYIRLLLRKTSRTLSNSSDPPMSPKTVTSYESGCNNHFNLNI
ncbi:Protein CBG17512 [Caenorhabditis briggsae]|uniref:Protein CBG17512 n=1 Tax=Caenorhabditis briggsae TaxID=6238 RepID=A8XRC9_CAEBR|nr:Protein CBG17512 [Caenorhabditis briggsae]CAP35148.1 Protein CBG17512 [Caenorhabditis briggsae]